MKKEVQSIFGEVIRTLRVEKGISQETIAYTANIDRAYISMLERGLRAPSINTIFAIADALEIKPSVLINLVEQKSSNPVKS